MQNSHILKILNLYIHYIWLSYQSGMTLLVREYLISVIRERYETVRLL